ncbi:hypothetical protein [Ammoniphilus sp. 3BR4]|uniref:hypothetical protein n=1 Tax=Ammoniphilus sp. 3BR4 TaxID=3158265 RepID=UPI003467ADB5
MASPKNNVMFGIIGITIMVVLIAILSGMIFTGMSREEEMDRLTIIDQNLEKIMTTPSTSSNPYDYIKANQKEFDYIVEQGDLTLNHFLNVFRNG